MPALLLLLLLGGGVAAYAIASSKKTYALSDNCQELIIDQLTPTEFQSYVEALDTELTQALNGEAVLRLQVTQLPVSVEIVEEIAACQAELVAAGMSQSEAMERCRVDGDNVYVPVDPLSPSEIALFLFQKTAGPDCSALLFSGNLLPAGVDPGVVEVFGAAGRIMWPTLAAECLYRRLLIGMKLALLALTGDATFAVTEEELQAAVLTCPMSSEAWGGQRPPGVGTAGGFANPGAQPLDDDLDLGRMARDLNEGAIGSEAVISGAIFR